MLSQQSAASVQETCNAINAVCKAKGGAAAMYSCKSVSWDDAQRGTVGGNLSCWGGNITDTRLYEKSGKLLYTCRPDNWNEKLGKVDAHSVAVVVGNPIRAPVGESEELQPITLADFLKKTGHYAACTGVDGDGNLYDEQLDSEISIRFQTTFLPVKDDADGLSTLEFCTETYNYNTRQDDDPRNAILLCTAQGVAFQQDGAGSKKLFHHVVDAKGTVHRYWLEAEQSRHKVGGAQTESKDESMLAAARGKSTASVIGIEAMGTRFNVLMMVQIPLQQKPKPKYINRGGGGMGCGPPSDSGKEECCCGPPSDSDEDLDGCCGPPSYSELRQSRQSLKIGKANAARVSRGSAVDEPMWTGVKNTKPKRDPNQHITVTVVLYNTVAGGVPSAEDVHTAIEDMERLYAACPWEGKLADKGADFMKSELTISEGADIAQKVAKQPYTAPKCSVVNNASVFPRTAPRTTRR